MLEKLYVRKDSQALEYTVYPQECKGSPHPWMISTVANIDKRLSERPVSGWRFKGLIKWCSGLLKSLLCVSAVIWHLSDPTTSRQVSQYPTASEKRHFLPLPPAVAPKMAPGLITLTRLRPTDLSDSF